MTEGRRQSGGGWLLAVSILLTVAIPASSLFNVFLGVRGLTAAVHVGGPLVAYMAIVVVLSAGAAAFSIAAGASLWLRRLFAVRLATRFTFVYVLTLGAGVFLSSLTTSIPKELGNILALTLGQELAREAMVTVTIHLYIRHFSRVNEYRV